MRCAAAVRAGGLGFAAEPGPWGDVYRRDAGEGLAALTDGRAPQAPRAAAVCLLDPRMGPHAATGAPPVVLDIEAISVAAGHLAAFLVGVGSWQSDRLLVEQFLLADVGRETAMLQAIGARVRGSLLLTYNGRAFDMRVLGSRCVACGIHPATVEPAFHLDLLAPTRRRFRERMPSCTLRQAEVTLLGYGRDQDVPGAEGPWRYRGWLAGGPPELMAGVVEHNRMDVCSTALLAARLAADWTPLTPMEVAARYNVSR